MAFLIAFPSIACKKGVEGITTVEYFPIPKFNSSVKVSGTEATLKAIVSTDSKGKITEYKILEVVPSLPLSPIENALKKAVLTPYRSDVKVQITFDLIIPNKILPIIEL